MKKIMLIGDSIRLSYQQKVEMKLAGKAEIWGPEENCRFAKYTLWNCGQWFDMAGAPDIVHWNNGIWDMYKITSDGQPFTSLDEYIKTLERILEEWKSRNLPVIWAATTAVKPNQFISNDIIDEYNTAAAELMLKEGILITDLNSVIKKDISSYISEDSIHLSDERINACADEVVKSINRLY